METTINPKEMYTEEEFLSRTENVKLWKNSEQCSTYRRK